MSERLGRFLLKNRVAVAAVILLITAFFGWMMTRVKMESPTIDLFPSTHPFVETFEKYSDVFGGASRVVIQLEVKEGDIFNRDTLEKVRKITKKLELLEGINNYQVLSIAQRKVKDLKVDAERGFRGVPIMWPDTPATPEEMELLKQRIYTNRRIYGTLVSTDSKATLIVAGFFEDKLDPKKAYEEIEKIVSAERDAKTEIQLIGRPIMLGYILQQYPQLVWIFLMTIASIVVLLALYFRDLRGTLVPVGTALMSAIWGLGFLGLLGYNFDPLIVVVPFIISARALSHSVQLIERYIEEYIRVRDKSEAAVATFHGLFTPGLLGIITDAGGVAMVWLTPIPLLQKLGLMGGFWVLSIIVSDMIFNPILLSFLPPPNTNKQEKKTVLDTVLATLGGWCLGWQRNVILAVALVTFGVGYFFARNLQIGDVHPGTPMLWPDSKYNLDTERIAERFRNTEELTVVVEGATRDAIKNPTVLRTMEAFQRHMETIPEVGSTSSLVDLIPATISILHGGDPRWEVLPDDPKESAFFLEMIFTNSEPGDLVRFVTIDSQNANITLNLLDHKGDTLRTVVAHAQKFIDSHPMPGAKFRLAGGYGGLLAAINEVIVKNEALITVLAFCMIFVLCGLVYRSLWAAILFLVPLFGSNYLTYALMGAREIGLDVNALPVVALGVGLGVDYGLYVVGRISEEFERTRDVASSVIIALTTSGKAVLFTAGTMVLGMVFWTFSFLRFQADMGLLLLFWMVMSMLGGLVLLPALVVLVKPKFVFPDPKPVPNLVKKPEVAV